MPASTSEALFQRALERIPGGVNSPVRAFRSVGGTPRFISRGAGAYVFDVDRRSLSHDEPMIDVLKGLYSLTR